MSEPTVLQLGDSTFHISRLFAMDQYRLLETIRPALGKALKDMNLKDFVDVEDFKQDGYTQEQLQAIYEAKQAGEPLPEGFNIDEMNENAQMGWYNAIAKLVAAAASVDGTVIERARLTLFKNVKYSTVKTGGVKYPVAGDETQAFEGLSGLDVYKVFWEALKVNFLDTGNENKSWATALKDVFQP